ncbi:LAFE_0G08702g1_1 [Lachancea fermentati]|uniref:Serine/threonine-protein phosphatase 2A activator n=1 Tax=Lachancea fermentati TaxID=4955 RepID=A0A1G4MHG4_LACFM|nr:LAFE_0G08702g1_1 [Lachancea fermentati]
MIPEKRLLTQDDMKLWLESATYTELVGFISELAESVQGRENTDFQEPVSSSVKEACELLEKVSKAIEQHPVKEGATVSRFGKKEFRDFYDDIELHIREWLLAMAPDLTDDQIVELKVYFKESWGNRSRIDYGSGHELNFICFLYCLCRFGILDTKRDSTNIVLKIFSQYLSVMRSLETIYWLEPAGSHGVWGLDDYHFLPFLFGAFQLSKHKHLKPKSIHNPDLVEMFEKRYMYFGCIAFINSVKTTASLRWHSPMLDDISGVKTWSKVAEGMIKMYKAEVLGKLPIMQHFFFGDVLRCPSGVSSPSEHSENDGHEHCPHGLQNTWGDCCGIRVPSAVAASGANKGHKPLPFD